jgi:hypothetical protein
MTETDGGIALARRYFEDLVAPVLHQHVPEVRYAAARVGPGSDVLGLDDAMSRDHDWGLRLQLFVADADDQARVRTVLERQLPTDYQGHPVRFGFSADPTERLRIDVASVSAFAVQQLGFDPRGETSVVDWLSLTGQAVLEVAAGAVFEDQTGEVTGLREALRWYPDDVWRYVVACDWQRLDQELPLMGRAGDRGDELGSRVIAARLGDIAVHLGFMLSRVWPPYSKWRGLAFGQLAGCEAIAADLERTLDARHWQDRQAGLSQALTGLARLQLGSGLPVPEQAVVPFWDRPYVHLDPSLVPGLLETVESPEVRALPVGAGGVEQQTDNIDILTRTGRRRALARAASALE